MTVCFAIACNHPINVTTVPDSRNATSGTLGSAKVENSIPRGADSLRLKNVSTNLKLVAYPTCIKKSDKK